LDEGEGYKVKRLTVNPGHGTSLQFHEHRSERWTVVQGEATVNLGKETYIIQSNNWICIPVGEQHQLSNNGDSIMQLIEVQLGDYLGEDDIIRVKDNYGRI
jgi:mannose-6-phosphate isomerase-like protein (cupin superfamily)